jgi:hypothetical protein
VPLVGYLINPETAARVSRFANGSMARHASSALVGFSVSLLVQGFSAL